MVEANELVIQAWLDKTYPEFIAGATFNREQVAFLLAAYAEKIDATYWLSRKDAGSL